MRGHRDLNAVSIGAVLCAAIAVVVPLEPVRIAAGLPLSLFLPGYAVTSAIVARISLQGRQVLLLSLALSLTTLVLCALLLTLAPGGLREGSWATTLAAVALAGSYVTARRRRRRGQGGRPRLAIRARKGDLALLSGALAVVGVAGVVAWTPFPANDVVGYTRLWVLPIDQGGVVGARVGVGSEEQDTTAYNLELQVGMGQSPSSRRMVLLPGQQRVIRIGFTRRATGVPVPITAMLFRSDRPQVPYRLVRSWIPSGRSALSGPAGPRG